VGDANITLAEALQHKLLPHDAAGLDALVGMEAEQLLSALNRLPHREYSIASIPQDGGLELVVRQTHYADGRLGIGSGWLTAHATLHQAVAVRIRENAAFHPPTSDIPLILIGNGTGIAGLRAHLKQRASLGQQRNWLIFGERNVAHDFYFQDELEHWRQQGVLTRLNTAFSRDQVARIYVQDVLSTLATDIAQWVNEGAAIYVCGSASGMAPAVHHVLQAALGREVLSALHVDGRYRRDVY
jgi:sulfite reductase (NADPH) flavoprotein alpha-component